MIKITNIIIGFLFSLNFTFGQLDCMQGIWKNVGNGKGKKYKDHSFIIMKNHNSLSFVYTEGDDNLTLIETIDGFYDENPTKTQKKEVEINKLKKNGRYYIVAFRNQISSEGIVTYPGFLVTDGLECETDGKIISKTKNFDEYSRIARLSRLELKLLYNQGKKDNIDYFKRYTNMSVKEVMTNKCLVYDKPGKDAPPINISLTKGDVISILEEKLKWLRIDLSEDSIRYAWIKKEDVYQ